MSKRTALLLFCFSFISLLMVSCNETQPTFEIKTKVTDDLNIWKINDGFIRTMQTNNYTKWDVNIDGSKTIFSGTMNSFSGYIYGDNMPVSVTLSTLVENDLNAWVYETGNSNNSVLYIRTIETDNFNSIQVYNGNNYVIIEIHTQQKNDFTNWYIQMNDHQSNILNDPHYFGLYLIPVLIAVNQYY